MQELLLAVARGLVEDTEKIYKARSKFQFDELN